jgi:hypothetical protein
MFRVCVCSLSMQREWATLSFVVCTALLYFSTLSHKRKDFRKKKISDIKCVLIFCTTAVWNITNSKKNSTIYIYIHTDLHVKCPLFLSDSNWGGVFSTDFQLLDSKKIQPMGTDLFHSDGRADVMSYQSHFAVLRTDLKRSATYEYRPPPNRTVCLACMLPVQCVLGSHLGSTIAHNDSPSPWYSLRP